MGWFRVWKSGCAGREGGVGLDKLAVGLEVPDDARIR